MKLTILLACFLAVGGEATSVPERRTLFSSLTPNRSPSPPPSPDWTGKLGFAVGKKTPGIMKTTDGGENWAVVAEGRVAGCGDVKVSDSGEVVWAVCNASARGVAVKSLDSGVTWEEQKLPPSCADSMSGISMIDVYTAFAVGHNATSSCLLKTENGGSTWTELHYSTESNGIPKGIPFQSINAQSRDVVFATGSPGENPNIKPSDYARASMLRSTDGGKSWMSIDTAPSTHGFLDVSPAALDCGRAAAVSAGGKGKVMNSRDVASMDGVWNVGNANPDLFDNNGIVMVKADTAYMANDLKVNKLRLSDDGVEIEEDITVPNATENYIMAITAVPHTEGGEPKLWVGTSGHYPGNLQYSPDGGKTWSLQFNNQSDPKISFRRISFVGDLRRPGVTFSC